MAQRENARNLDFQEFPEEAILKREALAGKGNDEKEDPSWSFDKESYSRALEKLLFDVEASYKKKETASEALIARQAIEIEQLKADISAIEQSGVDALQRHLRVKEKLLRQLELQAQNEEKLLKSNADYDARHQEDIERYDVLLERSQSLVAKANEEIEKLEQETTLRIRCLELENKKTKVELTSFEEKYALVEQEKAELIKLIKQQVKP